MKRRFGTQMANALVGSFRIFELVVEKSIWRKSIDFVGRWLRTISIGTRVLWLEDEITFFMRLSSYVGFWQMFLDATPSSVSLFQLMPW